MVMLETFVSWIIVVSSITAGVGFVVEDSDGGVGVTVMVGPDTVMVRLLVVV